jgi:hypothetical protein
LRFGARIIDGFVLVMEKAAKAAARLGIGSPLRPWRTTPDADGCGAVLISAG